MQQFYKDYIPSAVDWIVNWDSGLTIVNMSTGGITTLFQGASGYSMNEDGHQIVGGTELWIPYVDYRTGQEPCAKYPSQTTFEGGQYVKGADKEVMYNSGTVVFHSDIYPTSIIECYTTTDSTSTKRFAMIDGDSYWYYARAAYNGQIFKYSDWIGTLVSCFTLTGKTIYHIDIDDSGNIWAYFQDSSDYFNYVAKYTGFSSTENIKIKKSLGSNFLAKGDPWVFPYNAHSNAWSGWIAAGGGTPGYSTKNLIVCQLSLVDTFYFYTDESTGNFVKSYPFARSERFLDTDIYFNKTNKFSGANGIYYGMGVCFDPDGNLWLAGQKYGASFDGKHIWKFQGVDGKQPIYHCLCTISSYQSSQQIYVDGSNNLYLCYNDRIRRYPDFGTSYDAEVYVYDIGTSYAFFFVGSDIWVSHYDGNKFSKHSGFTATVTDSFSTTYSVRGACWDGTNLWCCVLNTDYYLHQKDGFSDSILNSYGPYGTNFKMATKSIPTGALNDNDVVSPVWPVQSGPTFLTWDAGGRGDEPTGTYKVYIRGGSSEFGQLDYAPNNWEETTRNNAVVRSGWNYFQYRIATSSISASSSSSESSSSTSESSSSRSSSSRSSSSTSESSSSRSSSSRSSSSSSQGSEERLFILTDSYDGDTVFVDDSPWGNTVNTNATVEHSDNNPLIGVTSGYMGVSGYLQIVGGSKLYLSQWDFWMEFNVYFLTSGTDKTIVGQWDEDGTYDQAWRLRLDTSNYLIFEANLGFETVSLVSSSPVNVLDWLKIQVVRKSTNWYLFVNNRERATDTTTLTATVNSDLENVQFVFGGGWKYSGGNPVHGIEMYFEEPKLYIDASFSSVSSSSSSGSRSSSSSASISSSSSSSMTP